MRYACLILLCGLIGLTAAMHRPVPAGERPVLVWLTDPNPVRKQQIEAFEIGRAHV